MSRSAKTIFFFGVYVFLTGIAILISPNFIFKTFGLPLTDEVYPYCMSILMIVVGFYYMFTGKTESIGFFKASVFGRTFGFLALTAVVLVKLGPPIILLFGLLDLLGAIITGIELKKENKF
ncbi:MAG: hypothetical protein R2728_01000 [Chitinophagales bacterium]